MTTTCPSLVIVCPTWCTDDRTHHQANLANYEGDCIHHSEAVTTQSSEEQGEPVSVWHTSQTTPDGRETDSAMFWISAHEMSASQALAVADALRSAVETYRAARGTS